MEKLLTRAGLKERLNISQSTYEKLVNEGIPCVRLSVRGMRRFDFDEVIAWLKERGA